MKLKVKSFAILISSLLILFSIYFVFALIVSPSSYSVNESVTSLYNITIRDVNITQVNITLPANFTFSATSNGTNASNVVRANFTNITGNILIWTNSTSQFYLINGTNTTTFWFNATANYPGNYNFSVSVMNATNTYVNNSINITVNDTTNPTASFGVNPVDVFNSSTASLTFDLKCSDGYSVNDAELWGNWSGSWALNQTNASMVNNTFWNVSLNLSDGFYIWGVYCNDSAINSDWTNTNRTLVVDVTNPTAVASCTASTIHTGDLITCSCSGTDATSGVNSTSAGSTPDTSNGGTYTYTCNVIDFSGNSASSTFTYTISGGGSSSSSTTSNNFWNKGTFFISDSQFKESFSQELSKQQRFKVNVEFESHYIGVVDLTSSTVTINVSSNPQQAVLIVGDERKFEVNGDEYYDILVKLNSINGEKANLTVQSINEFITQEQIIEEKEKEDSSKNLKDIETEKTFNKLKGLWWLWVLIILILSVGGYFLFKKSSKKKVK
ncbi:MAG: hypothetical protein WC812_00935 [Candidatus Pacearchaeota archaeon]|jgi:hypothetical protein